MLQGRGLLDDATVLDLYAGTGALGIEALSRGAAHATFVERERDALRALEQNVEALGLSAVATVHRCPVDRAVGRVAAGTGFTLVFLDPPYADAAAAAVQLVAMGPVIAPSATVVFEHSSRDAVPALAGFDCTDSRVYGDTQVSFFARPEAAEIADPSQ
jgi:16S rRNA (guanine966-N2)-methyltransferase